MSKDVIGLLPPHSNNLRQIVVLMILLYSMCMTVEVEKTPYLDAKQQICSLVQMNEKKAVTIKVLNTQRQPNGNNCGLFALANATELALNKDPKICFFLCCLYESPPACIIRKLQDFLFSDCEGKKSFPWLFLLENLHRVPLMSLPKN